MSAIEILLLSLSLAIDCFAVSCVIGITQPNLKKKFLYRYALSFGIFQGAMPLFGWAFGGSILSLIGKAAPYTAFAILAFLGIKMIIDGIKNSDQKSENIDVEKLKNVIILSIATSIDALAVGFSFAMIQQSIVFPIISITITSFAISIIAFYLSRKIANGKISKYASVIGGCVLLLIGVKILFF